MRLRNNSCDERNDINIKAKDVDGNTALIGAATTGYETVVKLLLEHRDVEANLPNNRGRAPLWYAGRRKQMSVARLMLEYDFVDATNVYMGNSSDYEESDD